MWLAGQGGQLTLRSRGTNKRSKKQCHSLLTGVQALSDGGGLDQVASAQVAGDEVVEVPYQVLPARCRHT